MILIHVFQFYVVTFNNSVVTAFVNKDLLELAACPRCVWAEVVGHFKQSVQEKIIPNIRKKSNT